MTGSNLSLTLAALAGVFTMGVAGTCDADLVLIDFGQSANQTSEAPVGVFWNNVVGTDDSIGNAIDTSGATTGISLTISSNFTGPGANGGLASPSPALLGDLAVGSVTQDYLFFVSSLSPQITLGGLDSNSSYELSFFGTRNTISARTTTYSVTGGDGLLPSLTLTTSGTDIGSDGAYDGNDNMIAMLSGVSADGADEITIDFAATGGFGYLGAMSIRVAAIPEPTATLAFALGAVGFASRRRCLRPSE